MVVGWFYQQVLPGFKAQVQGPHSSDQMREFATAGKFAAKTMLWSNTAALTKRGGGRPIDVPAPDAEQRKQFVELGILFDLDDPISTFRVGEDGYGLSQVEWREASKDWGRVGSRDPTGSKSALDEEMDGQTRRKKKTKTRLGMVCGCCLAVLAAPLLCCCKEG